MAADLDSTIRALAADDGTLAFNRGIEREALRVDAQGNLARSPHPEFLGSKLCHPSITTDFAEAQLELITPVSASIDETLSCLTEIHQFVYSGMGSEVLWAASMPCVLHGDNNITLAQYGTSNLGLLKTAYRNGLGHRYGRAMQTICAVHYNFSFSDAMWASLSAHEGETNPDAGWRSRRYFDMMRNFRRLSWLPVYLFGASPAVCNSFVKGRAHDLERFDEGSLYARGATSLRCGNLGYQSDTQQGLVRVCYDTLENYVSTLAEAICTPHEDYVKLGLVNGDEYIQVNDSILQSEAEFYTTIRAKRVPPKGANFLKVLLEGGVEYVEIRLLDVNPFLPLGIDAGEIRFLDMLLLYCLLTDSPELSDEECADTGANIQQVVYRGREAGTMLGDAGAARSIAEWGQSVADAMMPIAEAMDRVHGGTAYIDSLRAERDKLVEPAQTPSARVLQEMKANSIPYFRFAMNKTIEHQRYFRSLPLAPERTEYFRELARRSRAEQKALEDADTISFDRYLEQYNAEYRELLP